MAYSDYSQKNPKPRRSHCIKCSMIFRIQRLGYICQVKFWWLLLSLDPVNRSPCFLCRFIIAILPDFARISHCTWGHLNYMALISTLRWRCVILEGESCIRGLFLAARRLSTLFTDNAFETELILPWYMIWRSFIRIWVSQKHPQSHIRCTNKYSIPKHQHNTLHESLSWITDQLAAN